MNTWDHNQIIIHNVSKYDGAIISLRNFLWPFACFRLLEAILMRAFQISSNSHAYNHESRFHLIEQRDRAVKKPAF